MRQVGNFASGTIDMQDITLTLESMLITNNLGNFVYLNLVTD